MNKAPINEYGEGNCCPECGSVRLSILHTVPVEYEVDLKSGKEIIRDIYGNRVSDPSNQLLACKRNVMLRSAGESILWYIRCRKCGWKSEIFTP